MTDFPEMWSERSLSVLSVSCWMGAGMLFKYVRDWGLTGMHQKCLSRKVILILFIAPLLCLEIYILLPSFQLLQSWSFLFQVSSGRNLTIRSTLSTLSSFALSETFSAKNKTRNYSLASSVDARFLSSSITWHKSHHVELLLQSILNAYV